MPTSNVRPFPKPLRDDMALDRQFADVIRALLAERGPHRVLLMLFAAHVGVRVGMDAYDQSQGS